MTKRNVWIQICATSACAILVLGASAEAQTVTIRAPVDGFVDYVAGAGRNVPFGQNTAEQRLADAGSAIIAGQTATLNASRLDSPKPPETKPAATATNDDQFLLFRINSRLAQLNLSLERWKVIIAYRKLTLAERIAEQTKALAELEKAAQDDRDSSQSAAASISDHATRYGAAEALREKPGGAPIADQLIGLVSNRKPASDKAMEANKRFLAEKTTTSISNEQGRLEIARQEYVAATTALAAAEASLLLGSITCMQKAGCRVVKQHAIQGQYVTRGDSIVEIRVR